MFSKRSELYRRHSLKINSAVNYPAGTIEYFMTKDPLLNLQRMYGKREGVVCNYIFEQWGNNESHVESGQNYSSNAHNARSIY